MSLGLPTDVRNHKGQILMALMRPDVAHFVRRCDICQKTNLLERHQPFGKLRVSGLFHIWSIDFAGPLPVTNRHSKYLLIAVEHLSEWPSSCDLRRWPLLMSDNDTKFNSAPARDYAKRKNIKWKHE